MEDVCDTDITDPWSAITEPHRLARWIAPVEGDLKVGGTVPAVNEALSTHAGPDQRFHRRRYGVYERRS